MMLQNSNATHTDAERAEFQCVVEALAKWPRLSHLLRYMGEKFFSGEADQLNEYNIATEVLGRSKTVFNAGEDAIARVETHRLRKRLAEFYESDGRDHPIQVTLPAGSYAPLFIHKLVGEPRPTPPKVEPASGPETVGPGGRRSHWLRPSWLYAVLPAVLVLVVVGLFAYVRNRESAKRTTATDGTPASASAALPSAASPTTIRLLAGYSGPARTDSAGNLWSPDEYWSGGGSWQPSRPDLIKRTSDPFLFEYSRTGDFGYNIPLKPGLYELHLYFSTVAHSNEATSFYVSMNGQTLLSEFDINLDAFGEDVADERVFRGVSPGKDGFLRLVFAGGTGPPSLNAIEILPGLPHAQLPIRLIMQTTPLTDRAGRHWEPDNYYMYGRLSPQAHPLRDSAEPDLFSGERWGHFSYAIPVDTRDRYTVILHFAELYFGPGAHGTGGPGSRMFKVMCNGETLLDDFDIYKEAGNLHELTKTFRHLKPSEQGKLNLTFEPIVNNATISGIEVLDESQ
ncbi:MAG TPA: malectin domain-containing carbohydrate-binding protein [Acidobacteriaceae bacterium]|nr:malectin domain-containing carbohydrate-binding protein [Acidobacteriaceae bacterium]